MLSLLPQLLVSGIAIGMLYALIALSMTILYRATTVVNFGHGDLVMVGAYLVLIFVLDVALPFVPALLASLGVLGTGMQAGRLGGELVYVHGAADAYVGGIATDEGSPDE